MSEELTSYLGNPLLKPAGTKHNYTEEELEEAIRNLEEKEATYWKVHHEDSAYTPPPRPLRK